MVFETNKTLLQGSMDFDPPCSATYIPTSGSHDKTLMWSVNTRPFTFWCLEKAFQLT